MFRQKLRTLAMAEAKEENVNIIKGQLVGKPHVGLPIYAFVYITEQIAGITRAIDKAYIGFGVTQKDTNQLTCGIAGATYNSNSYHIASV